jgi:hypothetical protein
VIGGLLAMSDQVRAGIETVVMDCFWPYHHAIEEALRNACIDQGPKAPLQRLP